MGFRDAHDAASQRVAALERELREARAAVDASPPAREELARGVRSSLEGDALTLRWSAWGTGSFFSAVALYPLPGFSLMLLAAWIAKGTPRTFPYDLSPWAFALAALVALWNSAALIANRGNRVTVTADELRAEQGVVPWLTAYRRRRVPRASLTALRLESDWAPDSELTVYRVYARCGVRSVALTGALHDEARARHIALELARAAGVPAVGPTGSPLA